MRFLQSLQIIGFWLRLSTEGFSGKVWRVENCSLWLLMPMKVAHCLFLLCKPVGNILMLSLCFQETLIHWFGVQSPLALVCLSLLILVDFCLKEFEFSLQVQTRHWSWHLAAQIRELSCGRCQKLRLNCYCPFL